MTFESLKLTPFLFEKSSVRKRIFKCLRSILRAFSADYKSRQLLGCISPGKIKKIFHLGNVFCSEYSNLQVSGTGGSRQEPNI